MAKHGKSYNAAAERSTAPRSTPLQAAKLIKELDTAKFDETVEAHFRLGIDTRKADQNIRGSISLPHGTGKTVRVAVFAEGEKAREAEAAGADIIGSDELVAQIQKGEINFDAAIATPNMMAKVGRIGKILGPRGLMPNPKLGTVTMDVAKMVSELKAGRVEYRADRYGICHVPWQEVSPSSSSSRTTLPCTPRSCASSPLLLRASTSSPSPCLPPWALASRSIPLSSATSWLSN